MTVAFAGTWNDVMENRPAFFGAVGASTVACTLLALVAIFHEPGGNEQTEDSEHEIEFLPGTIARLGIDDAIGLDPGTGVVAPEPQQPSVDPSTDGEQTTTTTPTPTQPTITDDPVVKPKPKPQHHTTKPTHGLPNPSTVPGKLPSIGKGNPFASPDGWSDMDRPGDAWATSVMGALANMSVGAYAADLSGQYKFQITICSDGTIDRVIDRGGDMSPEGRGLVRLALKQLRLPTPPASVRNLMDRRCQKIAHTFVWSSRSVK